MCSIPFISERTSESCDLHMKAAEMATYTLDGRRIISREMFWQEYVDVVQPDGANYFGRNLAALNDALWGGPGWPGNNFVLRITASAVMVHHLGDEFLKNLREIFDDAYSAKLELL